MCCNSRTLRNCDRHNSSSYGNHCEKSVSKGCYSVHGTEPDESSKCRSCSPLEPFDTRCRGNRHASKESITVTELVKPYYRTALDYPSYQLSNRSWNYYHELASRNSKMTKRLEVHMKTPMVDSSDPIRILSFLSAFQMACDTNGVHKHASIWFLHFFTIKSAWDAIKAGTCLPSSIWLRQQGKWTSYCQVVNYLLAAYAPEDIIARSYMEFMNFEKPNNQSAMECAQTLRTKAVCCRPVCDEYRLKWMFIEGVRVD